MFLKRIFGRGGPRPGPTPGLSVDEAGRISAEMHNCLDRTGGMLSTQRRLAALVAGWRTAPPTDRAAFLSALSRLNDEAAEAVAARYAKIEEAELFGRNSSRLAVFDAFETPRRRMLALILDTGDGRATLEDLRSGADPALAADIDDILSGR